MLMLSVMGKKHCKIRVFTLNFKNSQNLNFDSMKDVICKNVNRPSSVDTVDRKKVRRQIV